MKRLVSTAVILCLAAVLSACGAKNNPGGPADPDDAGLNQAAAEMVNDAIEGDAFSEAAALQSLASRGLEKSDIEPDWSYSIDQEKMTTYGDSNHGSIEFIRTDGEITDEEYLAWLEKVFLATAALSDDGHNIQGFSFGDGDIEKTWDEIANSDAFMLVWSYKYNGTIMDVYPTLEEDPEQESEVIVEGSAFEIIYHHKSVKLDVTTGLQKSFDETLDEMEDYLDEHGDEIEDVLKDAGIGQ
ncbi:MAG: hypothetical protein LBJ62_10240 [Bifidobacteriaceae bacterium]|jgi:hypothetical protein|nr:hypothetical protein [Bifidobacteriaceae bacterium]